MLPSGFIENMQDIGVVFATFTGGIVLILMAIRAPRALDRWSNVRHMDELNRAKALVDAAAQQQDLAELADLKADLAELVALAPALIRLLEQFEANGGNTLRDRVDYACKAVDGLKLQVGALGDKHSGYDAFMARVVAWMREHDGEAAE